MENEKVDLEVIPAPDYKKGSEQFMAGIKAEAKEHGLEIEFIQDIYPLRQDPIWYTSSGTVARVIINKDVSILLFSTEGKLYLDNNIDIRSEDDLEANSIFTDEQLYEAYDVGVLEALTNSTFLMGIVDLRQGGGDDNVDVYGFDYNYDDTTTLDEAFNFDDFITFSQEYIKQEEENKELKEDKENIELEPIGEVDYKKDSKQYMDSLKEEAKQYGFELIILQDLYPLRKMANWYDGAIAEIKYSDKISIMISAFTDDFEVKWVDGNPNDSFIMPKELESIGIFTDDDLQNFRDDEIIDIELYGYFNFYIVDEDRNFTGTYSDVIYDTDLGFDSNYDLEDAFDFRRYKEDFIPAYLKKYGEQSQLNENKEAIVKFIDRFGKELSDRFFKLKPRLKSPQNDISHWMKKDAKELDTVLSALEKTKTVKQKEEESRGGTKLLYSDENWSVREIQTLEASIKYGKDTKWCISGVDCETPAMWKRYTENMPDFPKDSSVFIFFIRKMYRDKYAVLFNRDRGNYMIWNAIDNLTAFINDAPKVKGLPDFKKVPQELKKALARSLEVSPAQIISIRDSYEEMYSDEHFEKYLVQYRDEFDILVSRHLYRNPDTEEFDSLEDM